MTFWTEKQEIKYPPSIVPQVTAALPQVVKILFTNSGDSEADEVRLTFPIKKPAVCIKPQIEINSNIGI